MGCADAPGQWLNLLRIPYGLDRLPRTIALDDPRLRCAVVGDDQLRLNSEPVPADAMQLAIGDHAARVAAATDWLLGLCGDYAPLRRKFVGCYFNFIATHLLAHHTELAEGAKPYDGLYAPEDWLWSALRPLPRGWVPLQGHFLPADIVFWDGAQFIAIELSARETDRQKALQDAGVAVVRIDPTVLGGDPVLMGGILPDCFRRYWEGQLLPSSPFRRSIPAGVIAPEV
jgi:hypothetical protein